MFRGLVSAFQTITILPVPGQGSAKPEDSLYWFPGVGLVLGCLAVLVAQLVVQMGAQGAEPARYLLPLVAAVLVVSVDAYVTRCFHLDGLADMCDGFGGGWTAERSLEIMRDSHIGSFGVVALVLCLLLKTLSVAAVIASSSWYLLVVVPILGRLAMVLQAGFNVYARRDVTKVSMANHFIDRACPAHFYGALAHSLLLLGFISWWTGQFIHIGLLYVLTFLVTALIGYISRRQINGITGDVLGATCELTQCALLVGGIFL